MTATLVWVLPDFSKEFILETKASSVGVGVTLLEDEMYGNDHGFEKMEILHFFFEEKILHHNSPLSFELKKSVLHT